MKRISEYRIVIDRSPRAYEPGIGEKISMPAKLASLARQLIPDDEREHFLAIFLDTKNVVKGFHEVSVGSLTSALVHPREAFRAAIGIGACSVAFAHNHPSGDVTPSSEDIVLTRRLVEAGKLLGIRVLDHVIVQNESDTFHAMSEHAEVQFS